MQRASLLHLLVLLLLDHNKVFRKGVELEELDLPITLSIKTKCPSKWRLIDIENGRVFMGNSTGTWVEMKGLE